jgi:hypothetical protein
MITPMDRSFGYRMSLIAGVRLLAFLSGWVLTTHYGDWRQLAGYPLFVLGSLPDGIFVRYLIGPKSPSWPWAMAVSLLVSSALVAAISVRRVER